MFLPADWVPRNISLIMLHWSLCGHGSLHCGHSRACLGGRENRAKGEVAESFQNNIGPSWAWNGGMPFEAEWSASAVMQRRVVDSSKPVARQANQVCSETASAGYLA